MKRFLLLLMVLTGWAGINAAQASPWPYYSLKIEKCYANPVNPIDDCWNASYTVTSTSWREISDIGRSTANKSGLLLQGILCHVKSAQGVFSDCIFIPYLLHGSPDLVDQQNCKTTEPDNWVLVNQGACEARNTLFGGSLGGLRDSGCVILGKPLGSSRTMDTPFGIITAEQLANSSRNTYCGNPLIPGVICNISIPSGGILDHGIQAPTSTSERTLDVTIACGANPHITVADPTIKLNDNRIQSKLTLTRKGSDSVYILKSVLTSTNATAGSYSGSTVVIVAPL